MRAFVDEVMQGRRLHQLQRRSAVFSHGVYTRYPFQAGLYGLPPEVAYECLSGLVRAQFRSDQPAPRNFAELCEKHFGAGVSRHFMIPYNTKLWGVPLEQLTCDWCERFVPLPDLEDVLRGAVGASPRELGYNTMFRYPELGIGSFSEALAQGTPLELSRTVESIDFASRRLEVDGEEVLYETLVSTAPLPHLLDLARALPPRVAEAKSRLRSTHLHYFDIALRVPNPNPYHWIYVPEARYPFYRVGCYSHFSETVAPPGMSSLYVELAERRPPDVDRAFEAVLAGLSELGLVRRKEDVAFWRFRTLDYAYVIHDHAYREALDVIEPFLTQSNALSTGRYGAWNYSSMEDALVMGFRAADRAASLIREA